MKYVIGNVTIQNKQTNTFRPKPTKNKQSKSNPFNWIDICPWMNECRRRRRRWSEFSVFPNIIDGLGMEQQWSNRVCHGIQKDQCLSRPSDRPSVRPVVVKVNLDDEWNLNLMARSLEFWVKSLSFDGIPGVWCIPCLIGDACRVPPLRIGTSV